MEVSVSTPDKVVFSDEATSVVLRSEKGEIDMLERHSNLVTLVYAGPMRIKTPSGKEFNFQVGGGALKVEGSKISILCSEVKAA